MWKVIGGLWAMYAGFALLLYFLLLGNLWAHENWVSKGSYRNVKGEHCCSGYDCKDGIEYSAAPTGWLVGSEFIPYEEGILDINKKVVIPPTPGLTICRRHDGSRRCVFGLKPGY